MTSIEIICVILSTIPIAVRAITLVGSSQYAIPGGPFTLTCDVPEMSSTTSLFRRPDITSKGNIRVSRGACYNTASGSSTPPECLPEVCSCTLASQDKGNVFTWTISLQTSDHLSVWYCRGINVDIADSSTVFVSNDLTIAVAELVSSVELLNLPSNLQRIDIIENQKADFVCVTSGSRPAASVLWLIGDVNYTSSSSSSVRNVSNDLTVTSSTLTLSPNRTMTGQSVICSAYNLGGIIHATNQPILNVQYSPMIVVSPSDNPYVVTVGQNNIVLICAVSDANPTETSIRWLKDSQIVSETGTYGFPPITQAHAGTYACSATNIIGTASKLLIIIVESPPETPIIIGFTRVTPSTLTLKWKLNTNGSVAETVILKYFCSGCDSYEETISNFMNISEPIYTDIDELKSGTGYTISVTASNTAGLSTPSEIYATTSEMTTCSPQKDPAGTVLIVTGGILISISVVITGISVYMFRKSRRTLNSRTSDDCQDKAPSMTFKNALQTGIGEDGNIEDRTDYEPLDKRDIGIPSEYEQNLVQGNRSKCMDDSRSKYENVDNRDTKMGSVYEQISDTGMYGHGTHK